MDDAIPPAPSLAQEQGGGPANMFGQKAPVAWMRSYNSPFPGDANQLSATPTHDTASTNGSVGCPLPRPPFLPASPVSLDYSAASSSSLDHASRSRVGVHVTGAERVMRSGRQENAIRRAQRSRWRRRGRQSPGNRPPGSCCARVRARTTSLWMVDRDPGSQASHTFASSVGSTPRRFPEGSLARYGSPESFHSGHKEARLHPLRRSRASRRVLDLVGPQLAGTGRLAPRRVPVLAGARRDRVGAIVHWPAA